MQSYINVFLDKRIVTDDGASYRTQQDAVEAAAGFAVSEGATYLYTLLLDEKGATRLALHKEVLASNRMTTFVEMESDDIEDFVWDATKPAPWEIQSQKYKATQVGA